MLFDKFYAEQLLDGLKIVGKFALTDLNHMHVVSGAEGSHSIDIKPNEFSFSLLSKFTHINNISNGGINKDEFYNDSCLHVSLSSDSKVYTGINFAVNNPPVFSVDSLVRSVKPMLISQFPIFVKNHITSEAIGNKTRLEAKGEKNIYKESMPELLKNSDFIVSEMLELSSELYKVEMVLNNIITITTVNNAEIYYDSIGTEIIQYSNDTVVQLSFSYVNANQAEIEAVIVEVYKNGIIPENIKELIYKKALKDIENNWFYVELNSGVYKILLQADASDVFFHEAFAAHLLSGTYISENISTVFKNRIGEFFPKLKGIDIIMDPSIGNGYGSYVYDHQGVKSQKVTLLENGVIKDLLTDKRSAAALEIIQKDASLVEQLLQVENIDKLLLQYVEEKYLKRSFLKKKDQLIFLLNKDLLGNVILDSGIDVSLDWRSDHSRLTRQSNGHSRVQWWVTLNEEGRLATVKSEARMSNLIINNNNEDDGMTLEEFAKQSCIRDGQDFYLSVNATNGEIDVENATFIIDPSLIKKVYVDGREEEVVDPGTFSMSLENFLDNIERVGHENEVSYGHCGASSGFIPVGSYTPKVFVGFTPYQEAPDLEVVSDEIMDILTSKHL
ncbi:MAG: TldD protein [Patescibacteria group bacterium]|nr:TldD protein [Patescibacteria group bacterium]